MSIQTYPQALREVLAQTLTRVDIQRGADDIRVVISGDGKLAHEVTRLDERRLMIDIPGVASAIHKPVISVNHQMLKQVRLGYHTDRVRVVLDLAGSAAYSVEPEGANLIVTIREGASSGKDADTNSYRDDSCQHHKIRKFYHDAGSGGCRFSDGTSGNGHGSSVFNEISYAACPNDFRGR